MAGARRCSLFHSERSVILGDRRAAAARQD